MTKAEAKKKLLDLLCIHLEIDDEALFGELESHDKDYPQMDRARNELLEEFKRRAR